MSESVLTKKNVALVQIINRPQMSIWLATLASVALIYLASPAMDGSGDPDYYWHMLYARWILEHGAIPKADFISWPFSGQTYLLTQWLGQVLIGLADKAGGGQGRALLNLVEACSARGARVAVSGEFCDADQAWFTDAGADMFIGHSFGVRVTCEEAAHFEASRSVIAAAGERSNLDSLMSRLGVQRALNVE